MTSATLPAYHETQAMQKKITDFRSEQEIENEEFYFLLLPEEEGRFGGAGISVNHDKSHLIGILNVDTSGGELRRFLKFCVRKYGHPPLPLLEIKQDSYFYSQIFIDEGSLLYVEEDTTISKKNRKLVYEGFKKAFIPPFRFRLRLDKVKKLWMAYFLVDH